MKSDRVFLCEWPGDSADSYNDIPWPLIHGRIGYEAVHWLNQQDFADCQMILERGTDFARSFTKLYAEFYNPTLRTEFALRFAK